ncbi:AraC-like ligand-binding domain-containing protein [Streptomyces sp. NPDC004749]
MWRERMITARCPLDMAPVRTDDFAADTHTLRLGAVSVWQTTATTAAPVHFRRTKALIRRSDPELYHLTLPLRGSDSVTQAGHDTVHGPYGMHIVDSSQPFDLRWHAHQPLTRMVGFEIPKSRVPLPADVMDRMLVRRLPGHEGVGALLAGMLTRLVRGTAAYRSSDGPRLETVLTDLFTAVLANQTETQDRLPTESRTQVLTLRIRTFIQQHLNDPRLDPRAIASAHNISLSYLHRLFQSEHVTVSALIRRQRLERARRDLSDPALRTTPIHRIAARWGFTTPEHFTRAFRAAYGLAPRDYRHQVERHPLP